jgi:hypothetical protein
VKENKCGILSTENTSPWLCLEKITDASEVHNGKSQQVSFSHSPGMYESEKELLGLLPVHE